MATKTVTTKSGKTIKVEMVRKVQDKIANLDGDRFVTGREIVEYTSITFYNESGKVLAKGSEMTMLDPRFDSMTKKGAVARVGDAYLPRENADLVTVALAELDAENPKSEEQLAMEQAKVEAHARWEAEAPQRAEYEAFERKMNDPHSDY